MSIKNVVFGSSSGSPLLVSASGVDAEGAEFSELLFDGNQSPLRVAQKGIVGMPLINVNNIAPAVFNPVLLQHPPPAGKFPYFTCVFRVDTSGVSTRIVTPRKQGASGHGGAVSGTRFFGVQFNRAIGPGATLTTYCYYMVFRNYG